MKDLWISVSGALAQQRNVETIANNVANANTPGFKKDQLTFKEHLTALEKGVSDINLPQKEWAPEDFYHTQGAEKGMVQVDGSYTIHDQGTLTPTKNPLDVAISGPGMFEVLTPHGPRYTRKGIFSLSNDGTLVNDNGYPVLSKAPPAPAEGEAAAPVTDIKQRVIQVPPGTQKVSINVEGAIYFNGEPAAELSIGEFKDVHALKKEGSSLYINTDDKNLISTEQNKSVVHQGFVEESNVNAIAEMSNLIKAHRNFESIQNVIKAYDNISAKEVNEIGKF